MTESNYKDSDYKFHAPIRYFTANDPYYWEVDNIPLQQLMENDLWLKDQIDKTAQGEGFGRADFSELKPYVNGYDNKVRVKPGRFTARINDTTSSTKFMAIRRVADQAFDDPREWLISTFDSTSVNANIRKTTSESADDATFLNGLMERAFTYPSIDPNTPYIDYRNPSPTWNPIFPGLDANFWANRVTTIAGSDSEVRTTNYVTYREGVGFVADAQMQTYFMRYWRGIARTSVVDVPEELEIEIPPFRIEDFNYVDENGDTQTRDGAEVRIDLVFIYSKPIDAGQAKVLDKTAPDNLRTITAPELGIVRGAGAIIQYKRPGGADDLAAQDENGNPQIAASVADSLTTSGGFSVCGIHGSFPSPDDLLNIAPLLSEQLEENDPLLVGQTILPVAYVVVRKNPTINAGVQVISENSLIDIRPFFRTTELTYAERAGIAAAIPAISISNPVVSKSELIYQTRQIVQDYTSRISQIDTSSNNANQTPRVVGAGYILGGTTFGVEATLQQYYIDRGLAGENPSQADLNSLLKTRHGYKPSLVIPNLPNWDVAKWVYDKNLTSPGTKRNDYINTYARKADQPGAAYGYYGDETKTTEILNIPTDTFPNRVGFYFVKKTIPIDRTNVGWMGDYMVRAQLLNCIPLSDRFNSNDFRTYAGASNIWVDKGPNAFTIYCAWVAEIGLDTGRGSGENRNFFPSNHREDQNFAGFIVINDELYQETGPLNSEFSGEPAAGIALYPSVTFEVIGIPTNFAGLPDSLAANTILTLS